MVDTVDVKTLFSGRRRVITKLTCVSDGTGESNVTKIDISTFRQGSVVATYSRIDRIEWAIHGFASVRLYWDHSTDDEIAMLPGDTTGPPFDWQKVGGHIDPRAAGGTGDILLSSVGAQVGATYDITIWWRPKS